MMSSSQTLHTSPGPAVDEKGSVDPDIVGDEPPDGGLHAWLTVVAVFLVSFVSFGTGNIWGIFQDAYVQDPSSRFREVDTFKLGFVGGTSIGFGLAFGPFSNVLVSKFGIHASVLLGVLLMAVAMELASIAKEFWQLLLSQGILFGIGASLAYIPAIGLPSQWFTERRALATGIASSGTGVGIVVLAPVVQSLIDRISISWAVRIVGFLCLGLGLAAVTMIRQRVASRKLVEYKIFDLSVFRVTGYPLYLVFTFLQFFGFIVPVFFIPSYCMAIGISSTNASAVLSVATAVNAVGRIVSGIIADKAGTLNVLITFNFLAGLTCVIIWIFAKSLGVMIVFAVFWGFFSGAYWALSVPVSAKIVGMKKLGSAVAIQFLANVIPPLFAAPIGARITGNIPSPPREAYRYLIVFSGLASMVASLFLVPVRIGFSKRLWEKI